MGKERKIRILAALFIHLLCFTEWVQPLQPWYADVDYDVGELSQRDYADFGDIRQNDVSDSASSEEEESATSGIYPFSVTRNYRQSHRGNNQGGSGKWGIGSSNNQWNGNSNSRGSNKPGQGGSGSGGASSWNSAAQNEKPRTEGYAAFGFPPSKTQGTAGTGNSNTWNSNKIPSHGSGNANANSDWNSGFRQEQPKTEGYPGFGSASNNNGNQWTGNSNDWSSGKKQGGRGKEQTGSGNQSPNSNTWNTESNSKKNKGSGNSHSSWNSGLWNEEPKTEGYSSFGSSSSQSNQKETNNWTSNSGTNSKKPSKGQSSGHSNWSSSFRDEDEPLDNGFQFSSSQGNPWSSNPNSGGNQGGSTSGWASNSKNPNSETQGQNEISYADKNKKTGKPSDQNSSGNWKPGKGKQPSRESERPVAEKPNKNTEEIDWTTIEKENKEGKLVLDLSQLWYPSDKKGSNQRESNLRLQRTRRKRYIPSHIACYCMDPGVCPEEDVVDIMNIFKFGSFTLRMKALKCIKSARVCCGHPPTNQNGGSTPYPQVTNLRPTCGRRVSKRASNDATPDGMANFGEYPWILRLIALDDDGSEISLCGASLIHSTLALTAASCMLIAPGKSLKVRRGEWDLVPGNQRNNVEERNVKKVFLHPEFDVVTRRNDLALIIIDEAFNPDYGVNAVCLPSESDAWDISRCVVVAWGKAEEEEPLLLQFNLTTVTQGKCQNNSNEREYDGSDVGEEDKQHICAHSQSEDICSVEPGASLMCPLYNSDAAILIGFPAQSETCNPTHGLATFTNVLGSIHWVTQLEAIYLFYTRLSNDLPRL